MQLLDRVVESLIKPVPRIREFATLRRGSLFTVWPSVLNMNNLKLHYIYYAARTF